jgi:striatin 1/3/4
MERSENRGSVLSKGGSMAAQALSTTKQSPLQLKTRCTLKSHVDGVRGLQFIQGIDALVSASEDCTLKVWDLSKFTCEPALSHQQQAAEIEPYVTLRGHTGPIMTMCGY